MAGGGNGKQHATAPSYVRRRRNRERIAARADKLAERIARTAAKRSGVIALPGPEAVPGP